ncbi:MAG TPA: MBL fold metallo-hydrolase [Rubrobacteraceae bacterium]|nr:MBL fold metallo-hydrolase [Rubrobacteraceae bacterium]
MSNGVPPAQLGTQPIGEVERVFEGMYQLKLPVPFPLKFIASYLVEGGGGWTIIDPGFDYPPAREAWEAGAAGLSLNLDRDVERIVVTHLHPDHIGLARWLEERSGAQVWMLEGEIENARHVWDPARGSEGFVRFLISNGMDPETAESTAGTTRLGIRLPERLIPLRQGDTFDLGDGEVRVVHTPGHSDFHFVLHDERRRLLFAGDHLLLKITPNIGLWTYTAPRPLERYLASLSGLQGLGVELVFPGHGPLFHDLDGRIDELILHHEDRLAVMHSSFDGEPATPFEVARRVFPDDLTDHQLRFALAETLAHLEHLMDEDRAERLEGDPVRYRAV